MMGKKTYHSEAERIEARNERRRAATKAKKTAQLNGPATPKAPKKDTKLPTRKNKKKGMFQRRKVCRFCADKGAVLDYKEVKTLRLFISETGKMTPSRISGTCAKHQRSLALCIKRARHIALLPYAASHM